MGEGDPHARLHTRQRQDGEAPVTGPGAALGHRLPECGRERAGRARRDADRARLGSVGASPTIARHHERHRESAQSHAPCETKCETLARRDDGAAVGGRRRARSCEGVPSGERMSRYAGARRCPPGSPWSSMPSGSYSRSKGSAFIAWSRAARGIYASSWRWCADAGRPTRFKPSSPSPTDAVRDGSAKLGHPVQNVTREHGLTPLPR